MAQSLIITNTLDVKSVQVGDVGTIFRITCVDQAGTAIDISATTTRRILIEDPSGNGVEYLATLPNGGADGIIQTTITSAPPKYLSVLDEAGDWYYQARVAWGNGDVFHSPKYLFQVKANISATAASSGVYPRMSMMPVTAATPDATTFAAVWAEMDALVGADGWLTMLDTTANWIDASHQTAIALLSSGLYVQISRSDVESPVTESAFLAKIKSILDLYGDKMVGFNICIEANGGTDAILVADANGRRPILLAAHNYIKSRYPGMDTTISIAVQTAVTAANWSTIVPNALACGVDYVSITDYIDNGFTGTPDIDDIATRYANFFAELTTGDEFAVMEFGASSHRTFVYNSTTVNTGQGETIQAQCIQKAHDVMVASGMKCRLFAYTLPYQQTWWAAPFQYHGLTRADGTTRKEGWTTFTTLRDLFAG